MIKKKKKSNTRTKKDDRPQIIDTKDFGAKVAIDEDGNNSLAINSPVWYRHQLSKFKVGETVTLYVSNRKPKRTQQQNRYYWGVYLPMISKETGELDLDALHKLFTGKFLSNGIKEVLGEKVRMTKSSATLTISEFMEFITAIEAETGIEAPPTENYFGFNKYMY
jgi:hypothetical protein